MTAVVVLEGPDGAGKTTVARSVAKRLNALNVHHGAYDGLRGDRLAQLYVSSIDAALRGASSVVLDRAWHSEVVYGEVFRNGLDRLGPAWTRMLERVRLATPSRVFYLRAPFEVLWSTVSSRLSDELAQRREQLERVFAGYERARWPGAITIERAGLSAEQVARRVVEHVLELQRDELRERFAVARDHEVVGNVAQSHETTLLVGEQASCAGSTRFPFVSFSTNGCSAWLTGLLNEVGVCETALTWVNALDVRGDDKRLCDVVEALRPRRVVALGRVAAAVLAAQGVEHTALPHPQFVKRFYHNNGKGYGDDLAKFCC